MNNYLARALVMVSPVNKVVAEPCQATPAAFPARLRALASLVRSARFYIIHSASILRQIAVRTAGLPCAASEALYATLTDGLKL